MNGPQNGLSVVLFIESWSYRPKEYTTSTARSMQKSAAGSYHNSTPTPRQKEILFACGLCVLENLFPQQKEGEDWGGGGRGWGGGGAENYVKRYFSSRVRFLST